MFSNYTYGTPDLGKTEKHIHFMYNVEKWSPQDFQIILLSISNYEIKEYLPM